MTDDFVFSSEIRWKLKHAIIGVFLEDGHECDMAVEAGEMFVRLIERGLTQIEEQDKGPQQH